MQFTIVSVKNVFVFFFTAFPGILQCFGLDKLCMYAVGISLFKDTKTPISILEINWCR